MLWFVESLMRVVLHCDGAAWSCWYRSQCRPAGGPIDGQMGRGWHRCPPWCKLGLALAQCEDRGDWALWRRDGVPYGAGADCSVYQRSKSVTHTQADRNTFNREREPAERPNSSSGQHSTTWHNPSPQLNTCVKLTSILIFTCMGESFNQTTLKLKRIVHMKMKIICNHLPPNLSDFISSAEHKRMFKNCAGFSFPCHWRVFKLQKRPKNFILTQILINKICYSIFFWQ